MAVWIFMPWKNEQTNLLLGNITCLYCKLRISLKIGFQNAGHLFLLSSQDEFYYIHFKILLVVLLFSLAFSFDTF